MDPSGLDWRDAFDANKNGVNAATKGFQRWLYDVFIGDDRVNARELSARERLSTFPTAEDMRLGLHDQQLANRAEERRQRYLQGQEGGREQLAREAEREAARKTNADLMSSFCPGLSHWRDGYEVWTGEDLIDGTDVGITGRAMAGSGFVLPLADLSRLKIIGRLDDATELVPRGVAGLADDAVELAAQRRLVEMTGNTPYAHYLGKHSPLVSDQALIARATTGLDPWEGIVKTFQKGKKAGQPMLRPSTRFNSYHDMLESIEKAQCALGARFPNGGIPAIGATITMDMLRDVGLGYGKGTGTPKTGLTRVRVHFDEYGQVISAFPLYE